MRLTVERIKFSINSLSLKIRHERKTDIKIRCVDASAKSGGKHQKLLLTSVGILLFYSQRSFRRLKKMTTGIQMYVLRSCLGKLL